MKKVMLLVISLMLVVYAEDMQKFVERGTYVDYNYYTTAVGATSNFYFYVYPTASKRVMFNYEVTSTNADIKFYQNVTGFTATNTSGAPIFSFTNTLYNGYYGQSSVLDILSYLNWVNTGTGTLRYQDNIDSATDLVMKTLPYNPVLEPYKYNMLYVSNKSAGILRVKLYFYRY